MPLCTNFRRKVHPAWHWVGEQKEAQAEVKRLLPSPNLLIHFDGSKPQVLSCDMSPYRVGAVLSHRQEGGFREANCLCLKNFGTCAYSQLDKEALAIIFEVKRFHQYINSRSFVIDLTTNP